MSPWRTESWVYPRVSSGAEDLGKLAAVVIGLSPRVRGSLAHHAAVRTVLRSIPACAGEPSQRTECTLCLNGLSPRVRGSLAHHAAVRTVLRSIPACAGEPLSAARSSSWSWVYPRVCGGAHPLQEIRRCEEGLSPRVRGSRRRSALIDRPAGSIPACAGEPRQDREGGSMSRVYPRVCGGAV